jgi:hypothetical protein
MSHSTALRPSVQPVKSVSPVAYRLALQNFRAALHQLQLAGERLRALPALDLDDVDNVQVKVAFDAACEDAAALCWAAGKSVPVLRSVAIRMEGGHTAERMERDEATAPSYGDPCYAADLAS